MKKVYYSIGVIVSLSFILAGCELLGIGGKKGTGPVSGVAGAPGTGLSQREQDDLKRTRKRLEGIKMDKGMETGPVGYSTNNYYGRLMRRLEPDIKKWNELSKVAKGTPDGREIGRLLKELTAHRDAVLANIEGDATKDDGAKALWKRYEELFATSEYKSNLFFLRTMMGSPRVLGMLLNVIKDPKATSTQAIDSIMNAHKGVPGNKLLETWASRMQQMKETCEGELADVEDFRTRSGRVDEYKRYKANCELAKGWEAAFDKAKHALGADLVDTRVRITNDCAKSFTENRVIGSNLCWEKAYQANNTRSRITTQLNEWENFLGIKFDREPMMQKYNNAIDELVRARDAAARKAGFPERYNIPDRRFLKMARKQSPRWKVVRLGMRTKDWDIKRTGLGAIASRSQYGKILYRVPGEKWCRVRFFEYNEPYAGAGKFSPQSRINVRAMSIARCD